MKIIKNKKGDKIISVYWFAILFIVAAAVAYMAIFFYGAPKDIRQIEARVLTNQIADCFSEGGYLKEGTFQENFKTNFLKECHLNFNVEDIYDWKEQAQYYVEVNVYNFEQALPNGLGDKVFDIVEGNVNLKTAFLLEESIKKKGIKRERRIDTIVIHYTATLSTERTIEVLREDGLSIHYIIDRDGLIVSEENEDNIVPIGFLKRRAVVKEDKVAKHAGCYDSRERKWRISCRLKKPEPGETCCLEGFNERSIGIELVNLGNDCGVESLKSFCQEQGRGIEIGGVVWEKFSGEQMDALVSLVSDIASRYNIPIDGEHIIGHDEIAPGYKLDPGEAFPWEEFIESLESEEILSPAIGRDFYVVDKEGNQYVIKILSIIGKGEKGESDRGFGGGEFGGGGASR